MKRKNIIIILIQVIFTVFYSCNNNIEIPEGFYIEKKNKDGNIQIISKKLKDTLLNDTLRSVKFSKTFNKDGELVNDGEFINSQKIGTHFFYKNNILYQIKKYVFFSNEDLKFLSNTNIFDKKYKDKFGNKISYLNENIFFNNKDTDYCQSTFVDIKLKNNKIKLGDTLNIKFSYYDSSSQIDFLYLYLYLPENKDLVDIIKMPGKQLTYNYKTKIKGVNFIYGFAIINTFRIDNYNKITYGYKVYKINKKYTVY